MNERSNLILKLRTSVDSRARYIKAKLGILVPSQIRALRLHSDMPRQADLAKAAGLHQSRISTFETPGAANMTIETLARLAAAFKVGLEVRFVSFSEMLRWENGYSQDVFEVTNIDEDIEFSNPEHVAQQATGAVVVGNFSAMTARQVQGFAGSTQSQTAPTYLVAQAGYAAGGM